MTHLPQTWTTTRRTLLVCKKDVQLEKILDTSVELYCHTSAGKRRPYAPSPLRPHVFGSFHSLIHPRIKATSKVISQRFVWPAIQNDCRTWAGACQPCQLSKDSRHTIAPFGEFPIPAARFLHIHIHQLVLNHPRHDYNDSIQWTATHAARSLSSFHHSRDGVTHPTLRLDILLR